MTNLRGRRRVRSTAGGLIASAAAGALLLAGIGISLRLGEPIRTVQIIGDLTAEQRARISQVVEPYSRHGLLRLDKHALGETVADITWTRDVRVRRVWPDCLEIKVESETPVARWGVDQLLGSQGKIIADDGERLAALPHLHGPDGSAPLVLEHYFFAREMAARLGLIVTDLVLDPADGWGIVFDSGLALRLGHNDAIARMQRFQLLYLERLANEADDIAVVDARYANAVAVTRKADVGEHQILAAASRFGSHDGD